MKNKIILILIFFVLYTLYFTHYEIYAQHEGHEMQNQTKQEAGVKKETKQKDIYYCPMHPSYISDKPGDCPICNMKLVKKPARQDISLAGGEEAQKIEKERGVKETPTIFISPEKQQLIGVKVDKVTYRPFVKLLRTLGRVAFDPELYKAQTEYIEALKTLDKVKVSGEQAVIERISSLVEAARLKLELNGLSREQIEEISIKKENDSSLLISYLDSEITWVYATIYEYELDYVKMGQEVKIKSVTYPDKEFKGVVVAVDPVFDTMTRSVRARIRADNKGGMLKPNMYVDIEIFSDSGIRLAVPREAVMDTGLRKIVFVSLLDGRLQSREVKTGVSTDEYVEIIEGIKEGESVVISGNFLIDAESKLKSALEGIGHQQHSQ